MSKSNKSTLWIIMIISMLVIIESLASIYYYQRGEYDSPSAIGQLVQDLHNKLIKTGLIKPKASGYYVSDDRYGWLAKSNTQFSPDYCPTSVTYTMGPNGERSIPRPNNSVGQILFIGGSLTFGHCVNNDESYPHILATEYWTNWEVKNMAVSGFGTHQAYMSLSDAIKSNNPPSMVIYGMIPHHIQRNYLSREWLKSIAPKTLPHFELKNEEVVFIGTKGLSSGIESGPVLREKELEMTSAYLDAMQQLCSDNNIPFIIALLPNNSNYPLPVINTIYKTGIAYLDLGNTAFEGISPKDRHPNPEDNDRIARAIATSFISEKLNELGIELGYR